MRSVVLLVTGLDRGGAESQVAQLAVALRRRSWEVCVVSLLPPGELRDELDAAGVAVESLGMKPGGADPLALARLASILRRRRPRVLHAHLFHANIMARVIRAICPVPAVVSTIHSVAESGRDSGKVRGRDRLYRITGRLADLTVCVSEAVAGRHVTARAVSRDRLLVVPNGIDTDRFRPDPARGARLRNLLGLGDEFVWLAAGRLMWKKDYAGMLRAMARFPESVLLIAGAGPQEDELRSLARELEVDARFLGPRDDVPDLMNACDGFLLSSVVEGLPLVLLEAASSGLPCVATDAGGVREAVLEGRTGYVVPPGNPDLLAEAMARMAALPAEARRRMAAEARNHAVSRFDMRAVTDRWERIYLELLESARCALCP